MDREEFEIIVIQVLETVPKYFKEKLENIDIVIDEHNIQKPENQGKESEQKIILALYQGVPFTKRGMRSPALPDKITIFKKAIESVCSGPEDIKRTVKKVVLHEIGHYFGMDEKKLRLLGY